MKYCDFNGYFDNVKLFIKQPTSGYGLNPDTEGLQEIEIKFVCEDCKKLIDRKNLGNCAIPVSIADVPRYHEAKYWCKECNNKRNA